MHVDIAGLDQLDLFEVIAPVPVWGQVLQLAPAHLVVIFDWVAQLHPRARRFGQLRFQSHDLFRAFGRFLRRLP